MISVQCPSCKKVHSSPESLLGKKVRCKDCQHAFVVTHDAGLVELSVGQVVGSMASQKPPRSPQITGSAESLGWGSLSKGKKLLLIGIPVGLLLVAGLIVVVIATGRSGIPGVKAVKDAIRTASEGAKPAGTFLSGIPVRGVGSPLDYEAAKLAVELWKPTKIGDSYYVCRVEHYEVGEGVLYRETINRKTISELRQQVEVLVEPHGLSDVDKLNGIDWQGNVLLGFGVVRVYHNHDNTWSEWSRGPERRSIYMGGDEDRRFEIRVEKKQGKWPIMSGGRSVFKQVDQSDIPSESTKAALPTKTALPRLVDLGSTTSIPCKMMAPILEELKKEYAGRIQVEFIDINADRNAAKPFGVKLIPTQVFLDAAGKELWRHEGFISKGDILTKWKELGVSFAGAPMVQGEAPGRPRIENQRPQLVPVPPDEPPATQSYRQAAALARAQFERRNYAEARLVMQRELTGVALTPQLEAEKSKFLQLINETEFRNQIQAQIQKAESLVQQSKPYEAEKCYEAAQDMLTSEQASALPSAEIKTIGQGISDALAKITGNRTGKHAPNSSRGS